MPPKALAVGLRSMAAVAGPEVLALQSPKRRDDIPLAPGLRVAYTARSNGQRYAGTITGRLLAGTGWHVSLDVGEQKDVDDSEAWRLRPLAAA